MGSRSHTAVCKRMKLELLNLGFEATPKFHKANISCSWLRAVCASGNPCPAHFRGRLSHTQPGLFEIWSHGEHVHTDGRSSGAALSAICLAPLQRLASTQTTTIRARDAHTALRSAGIADKDMPPAKILKAWLYRPEQFPTDKSIKPDFVFKLGSSHSG